MTVSNVHAFVVADGQFVVHNCGGLPTTVIRSPDGSVSLVSGDPRSGPYFTSTLSGDGSIFTVENAFREGLPAHASDVLAEQFAAAGGDPDNLQNLVLDNVIESDTVVQYWSTSSVVGSPLE